MPVFCEKWLWPLFLEHLKSAAFSQWLGNMVRIRYIRMYSYFVYNWIDTVGTRVNHIYDHCTFELELSHSSPLLG